MATDQTRGYRHGPNGESAAAGGWKSPVVPLTIGWVACTVSDESTINGFRWSADMDMVAASQRADAESAAWAGILWLLGTVFVVVLAVTIGVYVRRRFRATQENGVCGVFRLTDMKRLRDQGDISQEEYETIRARAFPMSGDPCGTELAKGTDDR